MTFDFAEALRVPIRVDLETVKVAHAPCKRPEPDERRRLADAVAKVALEARIATLEGAVAKAEAMGEKQRREAEMAAKRIGTLEAHIATLKDAVASAEALGEQRREEAEAARKRADKLVAELFEMTIELVEMSKRMAEQVAATNKVRAEFDDYRSAGRPKPRHYHAKVLTPDEARRVAVNIARLPKSLGAKSED